MCNLRKIVCIAALAILALSITASADPGPIWTVGTLETFVYSKHGYAATVPVLPGRPNVSSYGLRFSTELRATRVPRILLFEDALLLLGDSKGGRDSKRNMRPMTVLGRYGIGVEILHGVQLRATHGEGYDIEDPKTTGAPWNSVSVRFQRAPASGDYLEAHFYPPHNEYDPYPFGLFSQRVVARYGVQFAKKVQVGTARRIFLFTEPLLLFGDSRPQISYNYSAKPIAIRLAYGVGLTIKHSLQARFTQGEWHSLGGYKGQSQSWNALSLRYGW